MKIDAAGLIEWWRNRPVKSNIDLLEHFRGGSAPLVWLIRNNLPMAVDFLVEMLTDTSGLAHAYEVQRKIADNQDVRQALIQANNPRLLEAILRLQASGKNRESLISSIIAMGATSKQILDAQEARASHGLWNDALIWLLRNSPKVSRRVITRCLSSNHNLRFEEDILPALVETNESGLLQAAAAGYVSKVYSEDGLKILARLGADERTVAQARHQIAKEEGRKAEMRASEARALERQGGDGPHSQAEIDAAWEYVPEDPHTNELAGGGPAHYRNRITFEARSIERMQQHDQERS